MFCQNQAQVNLDFVKNKLLMEEARQNKNKMETNSNVAFLGYQQYKRGRGDWRGKPRGKGGNYSGNRGENLSNNPTGNNGNSHSGNVGFPFRCHLCNEVGHKCYECPKNTYSSGGYNRNNQGNRGRGSGGAHTAQHLDTQDNEEHISFLSMSDDIFTPESANVSCDCSNNNLQVKFVVDSDATNHLVGQSLYKFLNDEKNVCYNINVAKQGETIIAKKEGNINLKSSSGRSITLRNAWVCEKLNYNLLSVRKLEENGLQVIFKERKVTIKRNDEIILEGRLNGSLYTVNFQVDAKNYEANVTTEDKTLLHRRMGHSAKYPVPNVCEVCVKSKQTRLPFLDVEEDRKAKRILEIVSTWK